MFIPPSTINTSFFSDVLLHTLQVTFNTAYVNDEEQLITDRADIACRYMSFWLWIDLAAAMPFDAIVQVAVDNLDSDKLRSVRLVRILRLVRLSKLYKLTKFKVIQEALDRYNVTPAFLGLLFLCFQVIVFAHLVACFWFFLTTSVATGVEQPRAGSGESFAITTWATDYGIQYEDLSTRYVASLYWTYTTLFTVGYGDIHATNTGERFYSTLVTFCVCVVFGAIIARIKVRSHPSSPVITHHHT